MLSAADGFPRAKEAATRALEIDPGLAQAHAGLGSIAFAEGELADAAMHFQRALELDPASPVVLGNSSALLKSLGRLDDAIALSPEFSGARLILCEALLGKGDAEAALAEIEQESYEVFRAIGLPMVYHDLGRETDFQKALDELITKLGKLSPYDVASVFAYCGNADLCEGWAQDITLDLPDITVPTLLLLPGFDEDFFFVEGQDYMRSFCRDSWNGVADMNEHITMQVIEDTRVFMMDDQPSALDRAVDGFLAALPPRDKQGTPAADGVQTGKDNAP